MSAETVTLYTADSLTNDSPPYFDYYLDWTCVEVAQAAANYLNIEYNPTYSLLAVSEAGQAWLDPSKTLRQQNVVTGNKIVYLPPQNMISIEPPDEESMGDTFEIPTDDFQDQQFGGVGQSNLELLTGETDVAQENYVKLNTIEGFNDDTKIEVQYKPSYKFNDILSVALNNLNLKRDGRFSLLLQFSHNDKRWIKQDDYLENFNPIDGLTLRVFKRDHSLKINFEHQASKQIVIDIEKSVKDVVEEIANKAQFESYLGFTLWTWNKTKTPEPLNPNLSLPQQTHSIKSVLFKRKYFIFSREDFATMETAFCTFKDAAAELTRNQYAYLTDEEALNYLSLCVYAESDNPDIKGITDHVLDYLPPSYSNKKSIFSKFKSYIQKFEKVNQFNACRRVIKFLRRLPGFACSVYDEVEVEIKSNKKKTKVDMIVEISPLTIRIINPKNNVLEERISISKIIKINILSNKLEIQFSIISADGNAGTYNFKSPFAGEMKGLIETYSQIAKNIIYNRAKLHGGAIDISTINDRNRIMLFTSTSLTDKNPKKYAYDNQFSGERLLQCAEQNLGIPPDKNHVILVKLMDGVYKWIQKDDILTVANVQDGMSVYILKNNCPITVEHVDQHKKKILMDITKPIEDLIPIVFQKESLPNIIGYTFFSLEDPNHPKPLDTRYSIPEQTTKYDDVLFKRRFYVISGEVLQAPQAAVNTVADCNSLFINPSSSIQFNEEQAINLGILYLYSQATDATKVKSMNINYKEFIPPSIKTDKKFEAKFTKALKESPQHDRFQASKSYLGTIRQLPGFGEEKFTVQYKETTPKARGKSIKDMVMSIGPLKVIFAQQNAKKPTYSISYRKIISFTSMGHQLIINFGDQDHPDITRTVDLKIDDIDTVLMLLNYNIKIIRDLMLAQQRRKKQEAEDIAKRLKGGYIDENGILRTRMLDFQISAELKKRENLPIMWIEVCKTGVETTQQVIPVLFSAAKRKEIEQRKIKYCPLLWFKGTDYKWVLDDETLESKDPVRKTVMFILEEFPRAKIIFSMGITKTLILHIVEKVEDLVPFIASKVDLKNHFGFTLYLPEEGKESRPLNLAISIPEQAYHYEVLEFKRRFFIISKYDYENSNTLYSTFCDVRALILSGKVDMVLEKAVELMYYALHVDGPSKITKDTFPASADQLIEYVPPYFTKPNMKAGKKKFTDMLDTVKVKDRDSAMINYIEIARKLPTFGTTCFPVILVEEKRGKVVRTNALLYVGPIRVYITDEKKKNELVSIRYDRFISLQTIDNELSLKYCTKTAIESVSRMQDELVPTFVDVESEKVEEIAELILSHLTIHKKILARRVEDGEKDRDIEVDRLEIFTVYCENFEKVEKITYSAKDTGKQIIEKCIDKLGLIPNGQYSCLLRRCNDEFEWIHEDTILGTLFPFNKMTIFIYKTYKKCEITTDSFQREMLLNVERPISQLIDEISFKMYVDFSLGYTLYAIGEDNQKTALDLCMTIPEQIQKFYRFYFHREFLLSTKNDRLSPLYSKLLYDDFLKNVMTGIPDLTSGRNFKDAQYFLAYQLVYNKQSPDKAIEFLADKKNNINDFLPKNFKAPADFKDNVMKKLKDMKTKVKLNPVGELVDLAYGLNNFGSRAYQILFSNKSDKTKSKDAKKPFKAAIGPKGISITQDNKHVQSFGYDPIVQFSNIKDRVIIRVANDEGIVYTITLISKNAAQIFKLIRQYKTVLIPLLKERHNIFNYEYDKIGQENPILSNLYTPKLIIKSKTNKVNLYTSRQLDHPNPNKFSFNKDFNSKEVADLGLYYITYPNRNKYNENTSNYTIIATNDRDNKDKTNRNKPIHFQEKDVGYQWIQPAHKLEEVTDIENNSSIFIVENDPLTQVITPNNFVFEKRYQINDIILDICKGFCIDLQLGIHFGYTLYEYLRGVERPLDFLYCIPDVSPNYVELILKRRFYLFSMDMLDDENTLNNGYDDVKAMVKSGKLALSLDNALVLAAYSLYAEAKSTQDVIVKVNQMTESELPKYLPKTINSNTVSNLLRKFKTATSSFPPLNPKAAKKKYIIFANSIPNYGAEFYDIRYVDKNDPNSSKKPRPARILLSPYQIIIRDNEKNKELNTIEWHFINNYIRTASDCSVEITYNDENGIYNHIQLLPLKTDRSYIDSSSEHSREIFSYINDILDLFRKPEFFNFPCFEEKIDDNDIDVVAFADDYYNFEDNYDDLNEIEARGLDLDFDTYNHAGDDYDGNEFRDSFLDEDGNDYMWRASDDGLMLKRAGDLLDNLLSDLEYIRGNLDNMDANDLLRYLNFMNDQLKRFAELSDENRDLFLGLSKGLESLRELVQDIVQSNQDLRSFIPQIDLMIDKFIAQILPAKRIIEDRLSTFKLKLKDDIELNNPYGLRIPAADADLAMMLLDLSDLQEQLANCIHKNYGKLNLLIDTDNLIAQLQGTSKTITSFASDLVNQTGDPDMIRKHLIPLLGDVAKISDIITLLSKKSKDMGHDIPTLDDLNQLLLAQLEKIRASPALTHVNPNQKRFFSLFPGKLGPVKLVVADIESLLKLQNSVLGDSQIKANKDLLQSLTAKFNNSQLLQATLNGDILKLEGNPTDDLARSEAISALNELKKIFAQLADTLGPTAKSGDLLKFLNIIQGAQPKVLDALSQISSINITPANVQKIVDDISMLLSKYATLSPDVTDRFTDKEKDNATSTAFFLKDLLQHFEVILPALEKNPTSGQIVYLAQQRIIQLAEKLPQVKDFTTALHRITIDVTYPVLYERLITNIKSALTEAETSEDITKLPHLINFQKLQLDTGDTLNVTRQMLLHPRVHNNQDLSERLEQHFLKLKDNYLSQVLIRSILRQTPFSDDAITQAQAAIAALKNIIDKMQSSAKEVSDLTSNLKLEQQLNTLLLQAAKTYELLKKARMEPFRIPPKPADVKNLSDAIAKMKEVLTALIAAPSIKGNRQVLEQLSTTNQIFSDAISVLKSQEAKPTNDFYKIAEKVQSRLKKVTPVIMPIPEFNTNDQHKKAHKNLLDLLAEILKITPPSLDIVKTKMKELRPAVIDFSDFIKTLLKAENVSKNDEATKLFNVWVADLSDTVATIDACLKAKDFNLEMANNLKLNLLNLLKKLSGLPMSVRDILTPEQKDQFAQKLGELAKRAIELINIIRQLPGNKRIISDPNDFRKIEADEELPDGIKCLGEQCSKLIEFYKAINDAKILLDRPFANQMLQEVQKQFNTVNLKDLQPNVPESKQLQTMQQLKEKMSYLITSTELIAPIIGEPNIVRNIRLFNDNLNLLTRILSGPHFTEESASKFKKLATPLITANLKELDPLAKSKDVKGIQILYDSLTAFNNTLAISSKDLAAAKPRRTQQICDQLYQTAGLLLPHLHEDPKYEKALNTVTDLFELCAQFTSLPLIRIRFSDCIMAKKSIFEDDALELLSKQVSEALTNKDAEIKNELYDNLAENLEIISDNQSTIPQHLSRAAHVQLPVVKLHQPPVVCGSARTIFSTCTNPALLESLLSKLFVDVSVRSAYQINAIAKSLPFLLQQIEENAELFDDEARFNYIKLENSIKQADTSLLLQCQSLPTAVFGYKAMRTVNDSLQLLLRKVSTIEKIRPIVQPLVIVGKEYSDWINESDLTMMGYFMSNFDLIVTNLESVLASEKSGTLPANTRQFIRQTVSLLRNKDRLISYDMNNISQLAQLFFNYQNDILPSIKSKVSDSDAKKVILYHSDALDKIKNIIKLWINPIEGANKESLLLSSIASLYSTQINGDGIKEALNVTVSSAPYLIQPVSSKLSSLAFNLNKGLELKLPFKDSAVAASNAYKLVKGMAAQENFDNIQDLLKQLEELINVMTDISNKMNKEVKIDFSTFDEIQNFAGSHQAVFSMIDDKDCLAFAKIVAAYLDKLLGQMKSMSNTSELIASGPHKYLQQIKIKGQNGKETMITRTPSRLNNLTDGLFISSFDDKSVPVLIKSLEDSLTASFNPSISLRTATVEEQQRLILSQRLLMLLQQQASEFPEVAKSLKVKGLQPLNAQPDQIDFAIRAIQQQFEALNSQAELRKVQSRYSSEQIKLQQLVLTSALISINNQRIYLPTDTGAQSTESTRQQLFEILLQDIENNGSPKETATIIELQSAVVRGLAQVSLINQLITIIQQLNTNNPDIYTFIQSPEGLQLLKVPITAHQLLEQQQNVIKQVNLCSAPEMLNAFQKSLLPDDIVIQMRIIQHLLRLLTSEFGDSLTIKGNLETSPTGVLTAVNYQQQEILKSEPDALVLANYLTPEDLMKWQGSAFGLFNRVCCAQTILELHSLQTKYNTNAASLAKGKNVTATKEAAKAQHKSLVKEYDSIGDIKSITTLVKGLSKKQVEDEQNVLGFAAYLALSQSYESRISLNLRNIVSNLFTNLQNKQSYQFRSTGELLNNLNPLKDSSLIRGFEINEFTSYNLRLQQVIKLIISYLISKYPELSKTPSPTFTGEQLETTKAIVVRLLEVASDQKSAVQFIDQQIPKDEIPKVFSLLILASSKLNTTQFNPDDLQLMKIESRVFDMSALIQRLPVVGLSSATAEQKAIFPTAKLNELITQAKSDISIESVKKLIMQLLLVRASHYPDIATKAAQATNLDDLYKNSSAELEASCKSIASQMEVANDDQKLTLLLSNLSPNTLFLQQVLLESLCQVVQGKDVQDEIAKSTDSTTKVASSLVLKLPSQISSNKELFTNARPQLYTELLYNSQISQESLGRASLALKLLTMQLGIRSIKGTEDFVSNASSFENATSEPFTAEEMTNIQDSLRNLLSINASNDEITHSYGNQKQQDISRIVCLLNHLTLIVAPSSLKEELIITAKSEEEWNPPSIPSLFNNRLNVSEVDTIGATINEIRIPSAKQRASRVASSLNGILTLLPSIIHIPMEECRQILIAENNAALQIVNEIYKSKSTSYTKKFPDLIEIVSQISASLCRVMGTLPENIRPMIIKELIDIEKSAESLQNSSCLESTPENTAQFKTDLSNLLTYFMCIESALVNTYDNLPIRVIQCYAKMAIAIQRNDIDTLNYQLCNLKALQVHSESFKINVPFLKSIQAPADKVIPIVSNAYKTHAKLDDASQKSLTDFRKQLVDIINKETQNPFKYVESLSKAADVLPFLNQSKSTLDDANQELINAVHSRDREKSNECINVILKSITLPDAAMARSFTLTKGTNSSSYMDYFTMINSSLNALRSTVDFTQTTAISSTQIRRSTRSFTRMLNSMIDMCEDLQAMPSSATDTKGQSKIDQCRLDFLKSIDDSAQILSASVSAKAGSFIPETFILFMTDQIPKFEKLIEGIKKTGNAYSALNTNQAASDDFANDLARLEESFNHFKSIVSGDVVKIASQASINDITYGFTNVFENIMAALNTSRHFTDVIPLKPDLESAEKLKKSYSVPPIPGDTDKLNVKDAFNKLKTLDKTYKTNAEAFFKLVQSNDNKGSKNSQIVESMNKLYTNVDDSVKQILRVTTTVMNLDIQSDLANQCSIIARSYDTLLKELRAKFVLSGDWDKQSPILSKQIVTSIDEAEKICEKAVKIAEEEAKLKSAIFAKFDENLKPLIQATSSLEKDKEDLSKESAQDNSNPRVEFSLRMVDIGVAMGSAVKSVMLFSRSHTAKLTPQHDSLFKFTQNITKELTSINSAVKEIVSGKKKDDKEEPEKSVISLMKAISKLGTDYTSSMKAETQDETALKNTIITICKGANSLAQSAENSLNAKKQKDQKAQTGLTKEAILKRLQLESNVIKARIILEHNEKILATLQ